MNDRGYWMAKVDKQSDIIKRHEKEMRMYVREIERLKKEKKELETRVKDLEKELKNGN